MISKLFEPRYPNYDSYELHIQHVHAMWDSCLWKMGEGGRRNHRQKHRNLSRMSRGNEMSEQDQLYAHLLPDYQTECECDTYPKCECEPIDKYLRERHEEERDTDELIEL